MHIHLDVIGGIAGDMFSAAMLDAFPHLEQSLLYALESLKLQAQVHISVADASDKGLNGRQFDVRLRHEPQNAEHHYSHHHGKWCQIKRFIEKSDLSSDVKEHAIGIFTLLAQAEAKVHKKSIEDVHFHEVGAWDCIIDIVSAAWLICHSGVTQWSVSDLPWGGGVVHCAHGKIPVPAPATVNLLKGFKFTDDGEKGERITPTGAAILAWLSPSDTVASGSISTVGYGFGNKRFKQCANVIRVIVMEPEVATEPWLNREPLIAMQCDIDDMTPEMLSIAREKLRAIEGVLEITETLSHGKKGRYISTLNLLIKPAAKNSIIQAVLTHTSSLGVRFWDTERVSLKRTIKKFSYQMKEFQVKCVTRPDGLVTSKVESDCIETSHSYGKQKKMIVALEEMAEVKDKHGH